MKYSLLSFFAAILLLCCGCQDNRLYVSTEGNDQATGTKNSPLKTLAEAIRRAEPGTTIVLAPGTHTVSEEECMAVRMNYLCAFVLDKSGEAGKYITIMGEPGAERPIIDLSAIRPERRRVAGFWMESDFWHLKGFDIVGIQVTQKGHSQAENIGIYGANDCIIEQVNIHDGMGIGVYAKEGARNLVLNCDAYNNYDSFSEGGRGGNSDGFGFHLNPGTGSEGNVIRGCRAWRNSDDGIDLINNFYSVVVDSCWCFQNGYDSQMNRRADGTGVKAGGYGLKKKEAFDVPRNEVSHCIAWQNKNKGIYSNHHLGGNTWTANIAYENPVNYNMVNQCSFQENVDVPGYGHVLNGNISYKGMRGDLVMLNSERCQLMGNVFELECDLQDSDFVSLDGNELLRPRKADGSLPDVDFMQLTKEANARLSK